MTFTPSLHAQAADALQANAAEIAARSTNTQFAATPGLAERFGPKGVAASLRDARYNVDHLAEAVALGDTNAFPTYIEWLRGVLAAAHVPAGVLSDHLRYLADAIQALLAPDLASLAIEHINRAMGHAKTQVP